MMKVKEKISEVESENSFKKSNILSKNTPHIVIQSEKQITLMMADDDDFYFYFIETILTSLNYKIIRAKDGQEAINLLQTNHDVKLILMDIQMPVMDGFDATKEIRKINTEIPIIAQTSFNINGIKRKAINAGCNEFLTKPTGPEVLTKMISKYLKLSNPS
jgi:two-component system, cell cycle response regulator DivK